jgi:hypothetical protein
MAQMPLCPQALRDAPATAARLVMLLPAPPRPPSSGVGALIRGTPSLWLPIAIFYGILAFGIGVSMLAMPKSPTAVEQPVERAP